jgi:uncharacterized membrane protein (UPF0136 family)
VQHFNTLLLWIYIVLLLAGGLMGFYKGKSRVSLVLSAVFAAALALCALQLIVRPRHLADILLAVLLVVFAVRLTKTKKFMPGGLMLVITLAVLVLRNIRF